MRSVVVVVVVLAVLIAGCQSKPQTVPQPPDPTKPASEATGMPSLQAPAADAPTASAELGQSIYDKGLGADGKRVAFTEGSDKFKANPAGCALCHGADGRGVKTPKGTSPAVNYAALRGAEDGHAADFVSDEALKKAIVEGLEPDGGQLSPSMPRFALSEAEWAALLDYLKSLDQAAPAAGKPAPEKPSAP